MSVLSVISCWYGLVLELKRLGATYRALTHGGPTAIGPRILQMAHRLKKFGALQAPNILITGAILHFIWVPGCLIGP